MHTVFSKLFRYVLWFIFTVIMWLLFVGLAKNNWNLAWYVQNLNQKSRSETWQQGGIFGVFWSDAVISNEGLASSGEVLNSGEVIAATWSFDLGTWIDVYDPNFESDLNQIPQDSLSSGDYGDTETDFGFVADGAGSAPWKSTSVSTGTSKSQQLLDLINKEK